ncbi:MAG: SET domain-containing protein [Candidatus Woesearchaeota archaeon]
MKLNKYCEARPSKIHGWGVFALKDIKKGTDIIEYKGKKISRKEGDKRAILQAKKNAIYVFNLNEKYDIDGSDNGNGAQFINHSCSPNCETINYDDKEIWISAIKNIKKGEELAYDYGFDEEIDCLCNAKNCIGKFRTKHKN